MKKQIIFIIAALLLAGIGEATAQTKAEQLYQARQVVKNLSAQQKRDYYQNKIVRQKVEMNNLPSKAISTSTQKTLSAMPDEFWVPGEFEEVQAVLITWPYYHLQSNVGYYVSVYPINETLAYSEDSQYAVPYVSVLDTSDDTRLPLIAAQLASAIQRGNAQVWINICNPSDSTLIKNYTANQGYPLTNYRFFINPNNSIWYRDCGPVGFYYGPYDSLGFIDFEYYQGRAADDQIPIGIGKAMNIPVYTTTLEFEGGNLLCDGAGSLFTSSVAYQANEDTYGQLWIDTNDNNKIYSATKTAMTSNEVEQAFLDVLGLSRIKQLPKLQFDGGTGHIDLYAAMWDENNFVFTKYPSQMSNIADYAISKKNVDTILSMNSYHQQKYRGADIPLPKRDDNTWYPSGGSFEQYTRTYSNSTFVNNVIIQPIFSDDTWGARQWDLAAIELMKKQFPGYEIIPIDIRGYENDSYAGFDGTGGAIHCITKQIPADNPIRILHKPIQGFANQYNGVFPIEATITNRSGVASATCYWRTKGNQNWDSISMLTQGSNLFTTTMIFDTLTANDTVEYYISATSNNGKTITKPFTAPNGFYNFYYGTQAQEEADENIYDELAQVSIVENADNLQLLEMGNFYPNPAQSSTRILIADNKSKQIKVEVYNMVGQKIAAKTLATSDSELVFEINTSELSNGIYTVVFADENGKRMSKKFAVRR